MKILRTILALNLWFAAVTMADATALFRQSQSPVGGWSVSPSLYEDGAGDALIIWASLKNNVPPKSPWIEKAVENLKSKTPRTTFARALRVLALAENPAYADKTALADDVKWLGQTQSPDGGWGVGENRQPDKLNTLDTAWAIIALDKAKSCGLDVNPAIFTRAADFFQAAANSDCGYGYDWPNARPERLRGQSHALTVVAAITAMDIITKHVGESSEKLLPLVDNARKWLAENDSPFKIEQWYWGSQPLGQYRFFLSRTTIDKQAVADAIIAGQDDDKNSTANGLAEDTLIATAWDWLTLAECAPPAQVRHDEKVNVENAAAPLLNILKKISIAAWPAKDTFAPQAAKLLAVELRDAYSLGIDCVALNSLDELEGMDARLLWIAGCPAEMDMRQQKQMLRFVAGGGVVLFDSPSEAEYMAAARILGKMFGDGAIKPVSAALPLITGNFAGGVGLDVSDIFAGMKDNAGPLLSAVTHKGRIVALLSSVPMAQIASGNFSHETAMQPSAAKEILLNVILFADTQE